ncbi:hypothetical protein JCM9492_16120 [Aquifex pyrophilus]
MEENGFKKGDVILGYYEVLDEIGEGNFGKVYKVKALRGRYKGKIFALKVANNPYAITYLWKEAQTLILFHHPNIISLQSYLYKKDKKELYLIYEYMDFGTLKDYVESKGKLSEEETLRVLKHVVNALEYLHSRGYIHSDVRPENVIGKRVFNTVIWKLGDFGLIRIRGDVSVIDVKGALGFIAPEVFRGEIHRSSDIYSLGCVTYYMLTGEIPFKGETIKEVKEKNKKGVVEIPEHLSDNYIHSDVRPENVIGKRVFNTVIWKLGDFGLIRIRGDVSVIDVKGALGFIAPEVFRGEIHRSSDIYSLGCVTYYMLTGEIPFKGETIKEVKEKNKKGVVEIPEHLSDKMKNLLRKMLEPDYRKRFRTAKELKEYLVAEGLA